MSATSEPDPFAGSRQIDPSPLTQNEIDAALLDPGVFIDRHCWIRGPGGRTMPFRLFPYQWESLYAIAGNRFTFFLKARQLGISWLADAFILWLITANRGKSVLILSLGDAEAIEEMERIRFMWARLPLELRRRRGGQESGEGRNNLRRLEFPDMDSRVLSLATSEHAGTSYTATDVFVQELAKIDNADNVMAGIMPTMMDAPTGRLSVISTATGFGGVFSEIWNGSPEAPGIGQRWHSGQIVGDVGEPGEFVPIFIPWHARPGRDASYYATLQRTMPERKIKREYPACVTAETLISTRRGIIPIVEAVQGDVTESGEVIACGPQPISPVYRLETVDGRVLRGTDDHPVMTESGEFVGLASLQSGQRITLRPPRFADERVTMALPTLPGVDKHVTLDERWGRFLGYFMGDGSIHNGCVSVVCDGKDQDSADDVRQLLTDLIGEPAERRHYHAAAQHDLSGSVVTEQGVLRAGGAVELRVQRKEASEVLTAMGCQPSPGNGVKRRVCVPDVIWRSPEPVVREFLRGLFDADGSATAGMVRMSSKSLEFCREVQQLLLGFGLRSKIYSAVQKGRFPHYTVSLARPAAIGFHERIGFVSARKQAQRMGPARWERVPNEMVDVVASVELDGVERTYDLTVEGDHVFSANGILTHNTPIEAFAGSSIGVFSDEFDRYGDMVLDGSRAPDSKLPVVNSIDPGLNHAVGYLIEVYGDSAFVFDEVWEEDLTSPEMASKMIEAHQLHGLPTDQLMTYIDPYAIGRNTESKKTERDLYSEAGLLVDFDETQTPPEQRVKLIKLLFRRGRLFISKDCPHLIEAFERAQWATRRGPDGSRIQLDTYAKDGLHEHALDAVGTGLAKLFPPFGEAAGARGDDPLQNSGILYADV